MGGRRGDKVPVVPAQDKRICGAICLCQLTLVLSSVALVYLIVAVYWPSHRAFNSGIEPVPVMCQTVNTSLSNNCEWVSCGEWCLTKSSGFCPQINVTTRRNGTLLTLHECNRLASFPCPKANTGALKRYNCNNDSQCTELTGVFNCSLGHCANISELFLCNARPDGIQVDSRRDNLKLNGWFSCHHAKCTKYRREPKCDRYCSKITTSSTNVFLQYGDNVFTGQCSRAVAHTAANGDEDGTRVQPTEIWNQDQKTVLLASCHTIVRNDSGLTATDCVNGTLTNVSMIPQPFMNFTTLWSIVETSLDDPVDPEQRFLPMQKVLTIYNVSKLLINLDGCVNTLKGECADFVNTHGNDGDNDTAQSRFPCFYKKNDATLVVARFDLDKTWRDLLVAVFVPSSLFVVSLVSLVVIGHSVSVGDDAKMRCHLCPTTGGRRQRVRTREEIDAEIDLAMDGIIERSNAVAAIANTDT